MLPSEVPGPVSEIQPERSGASSAQPMNINMIPGDSPDQGPHHGLGGNISMDPDMALRGSAGQDFSWPQVAGQSTQAVSLHPPFLWLILQGSQQAANGHRGLISLNCQQHKTSHLVKDLS